MWLAALVALTTNAQQPGVRHRARYALHLEILRDTKL